MIIKHLQFTAPFPPRFGRVSGRRLITYVWWLSYKHWLTRGNELKRVIIIYQGSIQFTYDTRYSINSRYARWFYVSGLIIIQLRSEKRYEMSDVGYIVSMHVSNCLRNRMCMHAFMKWNQFSFDDVTTARGEGIMTEKILGNISTENIPM